MLYVILSALLVIADQIIKFFTVKYLAPIGNLDVIKNILSFTYVENRGAAFGILQDGRWFFVALTLVILIALSVYIGKNPKKGMLFNISATMIYAGAIGNFIDRLFKGYVVDMIRVTFIDFPVFNFADCLIVVGVILLYIYILFFDKSKTLEDDSLGTDEVKKDE